MHAVEAFDKTSGEYVPRSQRVYVDERSAGAALRARREERPELDWRVAAVSQATTDHERQWR